MAGRAAGPYYMGHALFSQITLGEAAYDYGGVAALTANDRRGGELDHFNPEQQAQIVADFYHRTKKGQDVTAYQPYIDEVRAA